MGIIFRGNGWNKWGRGLNVRTFNPRPHLFDPHLYEEKEEMLEKTN